MSNDTNGHSYLLTPRAILASLFSSFSMDYPESSIANITKVVVAGDPIPVALNTGDIALGSE